MKMQLPNLKLFTLILFSVGLTGLNAQDKASVTDIDGNVYQTVSIGTQVWMKENLKVTRYCNGDIITSTNPATLDISGESAPKYQWAYNGDEGNVAVYGRLYTWYAATDLRNVCPSGWHLPTDTEWTTLTTFLGGFKVAGGKLKETGTSHWETPNYAATNSTNFTALPGGCCDTYDTYGGIYHSGYWWSSTESTSSNAYYRLMYYAWGSTSRYAADKANGFSVRCIKD